MKKPSNRISLIAGFASMLLFVAGCQSAPHASAPPAAPAPVALSSPSTKETQAAMTPRQALAELRAGNARFVSGQPLVRHPAADVKAAAAGQYPYAIVLSCIDSRQPIELVLDQGIGDIFSARVAGNVLNDDILGSMEFACKVSGAKLIAVIGHSNCGAVKGAIDNAELGSLTGLLARIKPAIDQVAVEGQPRTSKNHELVDKVADANVRLVMRQILERSPVLREMLEHGQIGIVGGMYDLGTGEVHFYDK
jgi:carbonic anhydrase